MISEKNNNWKTFQTEYSENFLSILRSAREYDTQGLKLVALNPYQSPPSYFKNDKTKWAKAPLQLYSWKNSDYSFFEVAKRLRDYYEETGEIPNIGICGYVVVDFDRLSLSAIEDKNVLGLLKNTRAISTASGGLHFYFNISERTATEHFTSAHGGIDFIGQEQYVVAPPSRIAGKEYVIISDKEPLPISTEEYELLRDSLVSSFNLKQVNDSGLSISEVQVKESYITLTNGLKVPRISYEDTVAVYNYIFKQKVALNLSKVIISCPLHPDMHTNHDNNPSAEIFTATNTGHGLIHCYRCGYTVDIYYLLKEMFTFTFEEAVGFINFILDTEKYHISGFTYKAMVSAEDKNADKTYEEGHEESHEEGHEEAIGYDIETIQKAFSRKNSKLSDVYYFLISEKDKNNQVSISLSAIGEKFKFSKMQAMKYMKELERFTLLRKVYPNVGRSISIYYIENTQNYIEIPERFTQIEKVYSNSQKVYSNPVDNSPINQHQAEDKNVTTDTSYCGSSPLLPPNTPNYLPPLVHITTNSTLINRNEKVYSNSETGYPEIPDSEQRIEYCSMAFFIEVEAIVGIDLINYPLNDDFFHAEKTYYLPVRNAKALEKHHKGRIIKLHGIKKQSHSLRATESNDKPPTYTNTLQPARKHSLSDSEPARKDSVGTTIPIINSEDEIFSLYSGMEDKIINKSEVK